MAHTTIVWLRNDLRLADNPALLAACAQGHRVVALYVHETTPGVRAPGAAARWWLHHSLVSLGAALAAHGIALEVRTGDARQIVPAMARELDAAGVFWNRRFAPGERAADAEIKSALRDRGITAQSCEGNVLIEPWNIATGQNKPYSVFTPFWKTLRALPIARPEPAPRASAAIKGMPVDTDYSAPNWSGKLAPHWTIGEEGAGAALRAFLDQAVTAYQEGRDFPARDVTSRLSPHLRFGEISPRQVWHQAQAFAQAHQQHRAAVDKFLSELAWRDFNYHQLYHRYDITTVPMQGKYAGMVWRESEAELRAWQQGQTGLPIVDAGMRELWATGYMQNRVRMLTASLLSKNLLIDWCLGEQWFWDCLVDGDVASNPGNWQWVAGSGLDASPYFRIFNPVTQGGRFDATGDYVRRWVPELAKLPDAHIHEPAQAPKVVLQQAGIVIGTDYPAPIVDLKASRVRALEAAAEL